MHQQVPNFTVKICHPILILLLLAATTGCTSVVFLYPEEIEHSNDRDIVVSTTTGQKYSLQAEQYRVEVSDQGQQVIRGKGKVYRGSGPQFDAFDGTIALSAVSRIESWEKSWFYYWPIYAMIVAAAAAVAFAVALNGRGFGG